MKDKVQELEALINKIPNVIGNKIVLDEKEENIAELHVLANSLRSPKQIARDIQSLAMARFGIDINHKVISIAQVDTDEMVDYKNVRLRIHGIKYSSEGNKADVKVILSKDEEMFEGNATGPASTLNKFRLIGEATLRALENFIGGDHYFILEDLNIMRIARCDVMVTAINHISSKNEELLIGTCIVKKDEGEAVVKAVLDSVNRKLCYWI